ncbi:MAG: YdcF family protein [Clostridiales bacterium]|jgi:uncharacterized SAM-binding protein YcdF (DUF218 family)|nr:YdcF family protein [Clostridiales bacterium]OPZ67893.1 MAG: vancomycin high temperature exclusion protein [Firmicutes bacterium ADurb.Bin467]
MRLLKWMAALAAVGIAFAAALIGLVAWRAGAERTAVASDCIIVLGARVHMSGNLSDTLRYRCESALEAYESGLSRNIIVTGGRGRDEPTTEAEAMRDWFVKKGVPENRVFLEPKSTDTWENLGNAHEIMRKNGWKSAIVVTSDYHLERSLWTARDLGIEASGISAEAPKPLFVKWMNRAREAGSWGYYWLKRVF